MSNQLFYAWAEVIEEGPKLPLPRVGSVQARGLAYERAVLRQVIQCAPSGWIVTHNPWLVYGSVEGIIDGFAQPDIVIERRGADDLVESILCLECKLSYTEMAWQQLARYECQLQLIYDRPVTCLQVCKQIWTGIPHNILDQPAKALEYTGRPTVWHNLR